MKLVILDIKGDTLFDEADFSEFSQFENIQISLLASDEPLDGSIYRSIPSNTTHVISRLVDRLGKDELDCLPCLQYVGLAFSGWWDKYFDAGLLKARSVTVTNNSRYALHAVSEAVFASLFAEYRHLTELHFGNENFTVPLGREVWGRNFAIIGNGNIGQRVVSTALALGMNTSIVRKDDSLESRTSKLSDSDIVGIFVPKSSGEVLTQADFLNLKNDVVIINPSGYENIDTKGLYAFLESNPDARYVYLAMPQSEYFERFSKLKNARLYPLFSNNTIESRNRRKEHSINNLQEYLRTGFSEQKVI
jgi:lactate dehydrogenase-like 2-hydroxyacid dehydrogenase